MISTSVRYLGRQRGRVWLEATGHETGFAKGPERISQEDRLLDSRRLWVSDRGPAWHLQVTLGLQEWVFLNKKNRSKICPSIISRPLMVLPPPTDCMEWRALLPIRKEVGILLSYLFREQISLKRTYNPVQLNFNDREFYLNTNCPWLK